MATHSSPVALTLEQRTQALVALFDHIAHTRMHGLPMVNPALSVQALGFSVQWPVFCGNEPILDRFWGVLITPWFMNLVCLPLRMTSHMNLAENLNGKQVLRLGQTDFEMLASYEEGFGSFSACSLFSPMFEFATQTDAVSTAQAVLAQLRDDVRPHEEVPPRRAFFLGRSASSRAAA